MNSIIKKIGILGGTFDPAHLGHIKISKEAKKKFKLEKVYWAVTNKNPFKSKSKKSLKDRINYAKKINKISYEEMLEMASLGAKVMQPISIQDARLNRVNINVKSSFKNTNGTLITKKKGVQNEMFPVSLSSSFAGRHISPAGSAQSHSHPVASAEHLHRGRRLPTCHFPLLAVSGRDQ